MKRNNQNILTLGGFLRSSEPILFRSPISESPLVITQSLFEDAGLERSCSGHQTQPQRIWVAKLISVLETLPPSEPNVGCNSHGTISDMSIKSLVNVKQRFIIRLKENMRVWEEIRGPRRKIRKTISFIPDQVLLLGNNDAVTFSPVCRSLPAFCPKWREQMSLYLIWILCPAVAFLGN